MFVPAAPGWRVVLVLASVACLSAGPAWAADTNPCEPRAVVSGGTVTFSDSYNGTTTVLGTVQVQSANGTAVL